MLLEKLDKMDDYLLADVRVVKTEPIEANEMPDIKTEPIDTVDEQEIVIEIKQEIADSDNPLELQLNIKSEEETLCDPDHPPEEEPKSESESESESEAESIPVKESENDPDVTLDDFASSSSDSISDESVSDLKPYRRTQCEHCSMFVGCLEQHMRREHWNFAKNLNKTRCGLCSKEFAQFHQLKKHQTKVHRGHSWCCDICGFSTESMKALEHHIVRLHQKENEQLCPHCGKEFTFKRSLKRHVNGVHLNLRPYKCKVKGCDKTFKQPFHLRSHLQQVHSKGSASECVICGKKFALKSNLAAHLKNVHKTNKKKN